MKQPQEVDIAVLGAGAAGMATALFLAENFSVKPAAGSPPTICLLESAKKIGAKILVSGGGRCNLTHKIVTPNDFYGERNFIKKVLKALTVEKTVRWFSSLGIETKVEPTGKRFPVSNRAQTVLSAFLEKLAEANIPIFREHLVSAVNVVDEHFLVEHSSGSLRAKHLVLATGGCSLPKSGSNGHGLKIAQHLGHSVSDLLPALTPLVLQNSFGHGEIKGTSQEVSLSLFRDNKLQQRFSGPLLWTHFGVSGPVVLDISRHWNIAKQQDQTVRIEANFLPSYDDQKVTRWLTDSRTSGSSKFLKNILQEKLPKRFVALLLGRLGLPEDQRLAQLSKQKQKELLLSLLHLELPIVESRGWNVAEVTAGGVTLSEVNPTTMESKICPGLYFTGEILDVDGRLGGFNFQWAWSTAKVAAEAITQKWAASAKRG
ncbi:MAG: NAD(P)/FAD-dependent oxidoreductase [Pirellulaceae bacterium]|nr:NAD(P)/FAD-dependent oxidoreductase [Pirellulaceae bacterium]